MLLVKKFGLLGAFHTAFLCLLWAIAAGALPASAQTSPGIPVPVGTWTNVLTQGLPVSTNDWEQLVYAHSIQQSVMLSQYHQVNSEPNESIIGYNFDTNSWDVLDMGGLFHTENMPEGGESQGYFDYNANDATIDYHCCTSGSNQAENVNHTWWYDLLGQAGRDKQTPNEPTSLQPGGAFDVTDDVSVMYGGDSYVGTWTYDPVGNAWSPINTFGLAPDPSVILPGAAYDSTTDQVFIYGGKNSAGTTFYSSLYAYSVPTNTWTPISPSNGAAPPARCCMNFAYDPNDNIFLLYGGKNASGVLGDTWAFNPVTNTWTQL
ncbi:MAG TPA: kelch repeat-containing protein, partial [Candidatus Binatia bacterium]|nr:kelch repeat-containing protein [Candidatus Binatia bacterium]